LLLRHEAHAVRDGIAPTSYLAPADVGTLTRRFLREAFRAIALVQARVDRDWMRRLDR